MLDKRKRRNELDSTSSHGDDSEVWHPQPPDFKALFKKHFEAKFEPLAKDDQGPPAQALLADEATNEGSESDSNWSGISDEDAPQAELIHHTTFYSTRTDVPRDEIKSFMVNLHRLRTEEGKSLIATTRHPSPLPPNRPALQPKTP